MASRPASGVEEITRNTQSANHTGHSSPAPLFRPATSRSARPLSGPALARWTTYVEIEWNTRSTAKRWLVPVFPLPLRLQRGQAKREIETFQG